MSSVELTEAAKKRILRAKLAKQKNDLMKMSSSQIMKLESKESPYEIGEGAGAEGDVEDDEFADEDDIDEDDDDDAILADEALDTLDIADSPSKTILQKLQDKYIAYAGTQEERIEKRKHPAIKYKEALQRSKDLAKEETRLLAKLKREKMEHERIENRRKFMKDRDIAKANQERGMAYFLYQNQERQEVFAADQLKMKMYRNWERDSHNRNEVYKKKVANEIRIHEEKRTKMELRVKKEALEKQSESEETMRQNEIEWVLEQHRRVGHLPGINSPKAEPVSEQRETATVVILRARPQTPEHERDDSIQAKRRRAKRSWFDVDLRRFRNVSEIRGDRIGEKGGKELARSLRQGACPRLNTINLARNELKSRGTVALAEAFGKGAAPLVHTLVMRVNHISPEAFQELCGAMMKGGLAKLKHLDLRGNYLGDEGCKVFGIVYTLQYSAMDGCTCLLL